MPVESIRDLPCPSRLQLLLQSLAMLAEILSFNTGEPVYTFSKKWSARRSLGVISSGQGDDLVFVFDSQGCFVKGWVHDCSASTSSTFRKQLHQLIPGEYLHCLSERVLGCDEATFFAWHSDSGWQSTTAQLADDVDDGSRYLLKFLKVEPDDFQHWAEENYERDVSLESVTRIYQFHPLDRATVQSLNANAVFGVVRQSAEKIGFPVKE